MNWLRAYRTPVQKLATIYSNWQYTGGAWDKWLSHVPLSVCLSTVAPNVENVWINLPYRSTYATMRAAVQELAACGRHVTITIGNEAWNTAGPYQTQRHWLAAAGDGDALNGYCQRLRLLVVAIQEAGVQDRFDVVAECHTMNPGVATGVASALAELPPGGDGVGTGILLAIAPYVGRGRVQPETSEGQIHRMIWDDLRGAVADGIGKHAEIARRFGMGLAFYEAGHHLVGECPALAAYIDSGAMLLAYEALERTCAGLTPHPVHWYRAGSADGRGEWWDAGRIGVLR